MTKLRKIALTKLLKLELPQFAEDVIRVTAKYDPTALKIQNSFDTLAAQQPKMNLLEVPYGPHPLTEKMHQLHKERLKYAALITMQMRVLQKADLENTRDLVQISRPIVRIHLNFLRQNNRQVISRAIKSLFLYFDENPQVRDALDTLGFKKYLDELIKANTLYEELLIERAEQISERPKVDVAAIRHEIQYFLRILFDQISFYQHINKEADYSPLICELNEVIAGYSKIIKTRATCYKTRKRKTSAKTIEPELTEVVKKTTPLKTLSTNNEANKKEKEEIKTKNTTNRIDKQSLPVKHLMKILKTPKKGSS